MPANSLVQYALQNSQNEANHGVVSFSESFGLDEANQPFSTGRIKPFLTRRSR